MSVAGSVPLPVIPEIRNGRRYTGSSCPSYMPGGLSDSALAKAHMLLSASADLTILSSHKASIFPGFQQKGFGPELLLQWHKRLPEALARMTLSPGTPAELIYATTCIHSPPHAKIPKCCKVEKKKNAMF